MMSWLSKLMNKPLEENPVDKAILEKLPSTDNPEVRRVYESRWVWYHTILAVEIAFTNILLVAILFVLAVK
jgi:hypothetical protein